MSKPKNILGHKNSQLKVEVEVETGAGNAFPESSASCRVFVTVQEVCGLPLNSCHGKFPSSECLPQSP